MTSRRENTSLPRIRSVTYEELKKHCTYSDAWISINGIVYDITHYIDKHPFGDVFRGNLGTECGGLFSSSHLNTNVEKLIKNNDFLQFLSENLKSLNLTGIVPSVFKQRIYTVSCILTKERFLNFKSFS